MRCCCHHGDCCLFVFTQGDREQDRGRSSSGKCRRSLLITLSSLIQHCDKTHQHQHADQQMHQIIQSFLDKTEPRFRTSHVFPSHLLPLVSLSLSTLRLHDASAGAGLSGGRERGGPAVQDYFSGDSRRCEYEMCFFPPPNRVSCS